MSLLKDGTLLISGEAVLTLMPQCILFESDEDNSGVFLKVHTDSTAAYLKKPIGLPVGKRFAALYRYEPFWMRPAVVNSPAGIPAETQALFADIGGGRISLYVPLAGEVRVALEASADGHLCAVMEAGDTEMPAVVTAIYVAVQKEDEPLAAFMRRAAAAVATKLGIKLRAEKKWPAFAARLGWCTWDAFYKDVSPEKIREGLESFRLAGVPIGLLIVDDGWQSERDLGAEKGRRLTALRANDKFGGDLWATVRMAKEEFRVGQVLAWHSLIGYWAGVDVESFAEYGAREVARSFSPGILRHWPEANQKWWGSSCGVIPGEQVGRFFDAYHGLLKSQGIDGVKVDNQAVLESLLGENGMSRGTAYGRYRAALEVSVRRHFGGNVLHCMSCANDLLYSPEPSALTRTSTDFWPSKPETHGLHLWTNAIVSLWLGQFVHPDWDMFQSDLEGGWSAFHAAARAISGGPVYVSDVPGRSDGGLLRRLVNDDGTVPRCDGPAMPAGECLFADATRENVLLKLVNTNRGWTAGVIGMFNCRYDAVGGGVIAGKYSPADMTGIGGYERYLVVEMQDGMRGVGQLVGENDSISVELGQAGWMVATVVPIVDGFAVAGILEKMNMGGTIDATRENELVRIKARTRGTLGIWTDRPVTAITQRGRDIAASAKSGWVTASVEAGELTVRFE